MAPAGLERGRHARGAAGAFLPLAAAGAQSAGAARPLGQIGAVRSPAAAPLGHRTGDAAGRRRPSHAAGLGAGRRHGDRGRLRTRRLPCTNAGPAGQSLAPVRTATPAPHRTGAARCALEQPRLSPEGRCGVSPQPRPAQDRKSTRLNSSHITISYAVFCLKKKKKKNINKNNKNKKKKKKKNKNKTNKQ